MLRYYGLRLQFFAFCQLQRYCYGISIVSVFKIKQMADGGMGGIGTTANLQVKNGMMFGGVVLFICLVLYQVLWMLSL